MKYLTIMFFVFLLSANSWAGGGDFRDYPQQQMVQEPVVAHASPEPDSWWTENSFIALMGMLATTVPAVLGYRKYRNNKKAD